MIRTRAALFRRSAPPFGKVLLPVTCAALLLALIIHISTPSPAPEAPPELSREALAFGPEGLRPHESDVPFSGYMLSHYPDGTLRSRSQVVDGLLHGISEGWYPDGTLETRERFRHGISHGTRLRWYPDGQLASRAEIRSGQMHGVFQRWHECGAVAQIIHMHEGLPHGLSKAYFPSGFLQARVEMEHGTVVNHEYWDDRRMREPDL